MKTLRIFVAALVLAAFSGLTFAQDEQITIAMIPKLVGIDYFAATQQGAEQAVAEIGNIRFIHRGPTTASVNEQIQLIENFVTSGVDVIAIASNDPSAVAPALQSAMDAGILVVTFDADADVRDIFINQTTFEGFGEALVDDMVRQVGEDARTAIVTSSLTAPNQNTWIAAMRAHIEENYPNLEIVDIRPSEEDQQLAFQVTQDLMNVYEDLDGIFALSSVAFPGAAEAVQQAGRAGEVAVVGASTPLQMKPYMEAGVIESVVLWNPVDLGYLTIYAAYEAATQGLEVGDTFEAGRIGEREVRQDDTGKWVLLGPPFIFDADNIDDFNF